MENGINVFVTYSWDKKTNNKIYSFVDFLRQNGFNATCDRNTTDQESTASFTKIMNMGLQCDKIIVVLSELYKTKAEGSLGGVGIEYKIISDEISKYSKKYILVSFDRLNNDVLAKITPILYTSHQVIDLVEDSENDYQTLFSKLLDIPQIEFSKVAEQRPEIVTSKPPAFNLSEKHNNNQCIGYDKKRGNCNNDVSENKLIKYQLCQECFSLRMSDTIARLYQAQGYEVNNCDASKEIFTATLHYGFLNICALIIIFSIYDKEFEMTDIIKIESVIKSISSKNLVQYDKVHIITRKDISSQCKEMLDRLQYDHFTYGTLTKNLMNFSNYTQAFLSEFEENPLKHNYIKLKDSNNDDLFYIINSFMHEKEENAMLILGDYGCGKTSTCLYISYVLINKYIANGNGYLPIIIYLKEYTKAFDIDELLTNFFINKYKIPNGSIATFKEFLRFGKILLIFDGFDEVAKRVDYDVKYRVFQQISKYAVGKTKIIITCRPNYFQNQKDYESLFKTSYLHFEPTNYRELYFREVYINDLEIDQIKLYIQNNEEYLTENGIKISEFIDILSTTHDLWDLAKRPFLLSLLIKTVPQFLLDTKKRLNSKSEFLNKSEKEEDELINAATLYERYTDNWLEREDQKGKTLIKASEKKVFCENLAYSLFASNNSDIHFSKLPNEIKEHFRDLTKINDIDYFSHDIQSCSFLSTDGNGNFSFIHKSFMEYFVAKKIVQKLDDICKEEDAWFLNEDKDGLSAEDMIARINKTLNQNYITTEICLFIVDIFRKTPAQKSRIGDMLARFVTELDGIAFNNTLSLLAKSDIDLGKILTKISNKKQSICLDKVDISYATISNATIESTTFRHASFYKSKLTKCIFKGCSLDNVMFQKATIKQSSFEMQQMCSIDWAFCIVSDSEFRAAAMCDNVFNRSTFSNCNFADTDLSGSTIKDDANFVDCTGIDSIIGLPYEMVT